MKIYRNRVLDLYDSNITNKSKIARIIEKEFELELNPDAIRMQVSKIIVCIRTAINFMDR